MCVAVPLEGEHRLQGKHARSIPAGLGSLGNRAGVGVASLSHRGIFDGDGRLDPTPPPEMLRSSKALSIIPVVIFDTAKTQMSK